MEHPKPAKILQCLAYTSDHRRCRLERSDKKTCRVHRNYYTDWLVKHPLNAYYSYNSIRKFNELIFQLRYGDIVVTEEYMQYNFSILHRAEYMFLIRYANINPLWNRQLFEYCISQYYMDDIQNKFNTLLTSVEACRQALRHLLKMEGLNWPYILSAPGWKQLMGSSILIDELKTENQKNTLLPIFLEKYKDLMKEQELYIMDLKNELLEFIWHPSRIEKWKHELLEGTDWSPSLSSSAAPSSSPSLSSSAAPSSSPSSS